MSRGTSDICVSRRINFISCRYWLISKEEQGKNKEELAYDREHDGCFDAKIENSFNNSSSVIGQAFLFDSNSVSISTFDDVYDLKKNCLVELYGMIWRVIEVNKTPIRSNYQMNDDIYFKYVMELRR